MDNSWTPIIVKTQRGRKSAFASVGNGRIRFSQYACELLDNPYQYNYVKVGIKNSGNEMLIGFEFVKYDEGDCTYTLCRRSQKDKRGRKIKTGGFEITHKRLTVDLFGSSAMEKCKNYDVTAECNNMLLIHVPT